MTLQRITELTKEHYETRVYYNCHFHMSDILVELLKERYAMPHRRPTDYYQSLIQPLPCIMGIPIIINPTPANLGDWSLVQTSGEKVIELGRVEIDGPSASDLETGHHSGSKEE